MNTVLEAALLTLAFLLIFSLGAWNVHAYLDPGSGSILYQVLVGSLLAVTAAVRLYWRRIRSLFVKETLPDREDEDVP